MVRRAATEGYQRGRDERPPQRTDVRPCQTETPVPTDTLVPNASPVVEAGDDLLLVDCDGTGDEVVRLDGSGSSDPEGVS